jgi:hypothetical protein
MEAYIRCYLQLCRKHRRHENIDEIIAKVAIIGRTYSAKLERRKRCKNRNCVPCQQDSDEFYEKTVAPRLKRLGLDPMLDELATSKGDWAGKSLEVHSKLTSFFKEIAHREQRSLASKYLHCHLPNRFFIFDSRAAKAARKLVPKLQHTRSIVPPFDKPYRDHVLRCVQFQDDVRNEHDIKLSPRDVDRLLWRFPIK